MKYDCHSVVKHNVGAECQLLQMINNCVNVEINVFIKLNVHSKSQGYG